MKFTQIEIAVAGDNFVFQPYDRGTNGAFVFKEQGPSVHSTRAVVSSTVKDSASDKYAVQINVPRTCPSDGACQVDTLLGTDLVKTELRFLATTSKTDRELHIDKQIALLQELRATIAEREVVYA